MKAYEILGRAVVTALVIALLVFELIVHVTAFGDWGITNLGILAWSPILVAGMTLLPAIWGAWSKDK